MNTYDVRDVIYSYETAYKLHYATRSISDSTRANIKLKCAAFCVEALNLLQKLPQSYYLSAYLGHDFFYAQVATDRPLFWDVTGVESSQELTTLAKVIGAS